MKLNRLFSTMIAILIVLVIVSIVVSLLLFILGRPSPASTDSSVETSTHNETAVSSAVSTFPSEAAPVPQEATAVSTVPETADAPTEQETTAPAEASATHSDLYIEGISVEDVILYFNEVCLDSEFINEGDPTRIQKWIAPIRYTVEGDYTEEDIAVLESFTDWLNDIPGFPGISETQETYRRNLQIVFCDEQDMVDLMGDNFWSLDGGVTFWYSDDQIYNAIICYRYDISQYTRNSVILEEVYNGLGPVQDTSLREDSLIFQGFSEPQWLTPVDELILKLLYHPDIRPGMNAQECEQIIRTLYY